MTKFGIAIAAVLSASMSITAPVQVQSFSIPATHATLVSGRASLSPLSSDTSSGTTNGNNGNDKRIRLSSSSSSNPEYLSSGEDILGDAVANAASAMSETISKAVSDEPDAAELEIAVKKRMVQERTKTYTVTLPLASQDVNKPGTVLSTGITFAQVNRGRKIAPGQLSLDTLRIVAENDMLQQQDQDTTNSNNNNIETMDKALILRRVENEFQGVVVASVINGSAAWKAGVRAGDVLKTTSATLGQAQWPKSTLEGVRSAVSSRRVSSRSIQFQFQRLGDVIDNQFELTLARPLGLQLQETEDGFVQVTGFTENAPTLVRYAVKPGDRIIAVDSSLGDKLWPVSTVEGVISAVTARLPGQKITLRFQRPEANLIDVSDEMIVLKNTANVVPTVTTTVTTAPGVNVELISRCREILKKYAVEAQKLQGKAHFVDKYSVPAMVADKVVDALASAQSSVDAVTLSMIMNAYLSCERPDGAIRAFQSVTGITADGSSAAITDVATGKGGNQMIPSVEALGVYTISSLLRAHSKRGDFASVQRVLAAVEGQAGTMIKGVESIAWPGTGPDGALRPDSQCYNIAIFAASESGTKEGLTSAIRIFQSMNHPSKPVEHGTPCRDLVSYNTIIGALSKGGFYERALDLFANMKEVGIKPDQYTYASLVRAVIAHEDSDVQEMLYDMKDRGIEVDIMTYNEIVRVLCESRKVVSAKKIISEMEMDHVQPNSMTYGLLMTGLLRNGNPAACVTLFESACADSRTVGLTENVYLYTTAITAAAALGDHDRAFDLLMRMNGLGIKPNMKTLTATMGACLASNRPDLAVDIYKKIEEPDSYAVSQGLRALCLSGAIDEAFQFVSELHHRSKVLSGKQLMLTYKIIIETALQNGDYDLARRATTDLFEKGNIPSKAIFTAIFDAMNLFPQSRRLLRGGDTVDPEADSKYRFLLFLLDSVIERKLPCEGPLYSAILVYGSEIGGLPRKLSSLVATARASTDIAPPLSSTTLIDNPNNAATCAAIKWEDLLDEYDNYKDTLTTTEALPCITVRVASRDASIVMKAERNLSYSGRKLKSTTT